MRSTVAVAYSGGRDSTALLHATLAAVGGSGVDVVALHVHHGLSACADEWLAHCAVQCARWAASGAPLAFDSRRIETRPPRGASVEAWARDARYAALAEMAQVHGSGLVLLGHHRSDQAETVLLQALRGGGAAGLAAMPRTRRQGGIVWARPWLGVAPARIASYVEAHALAHVEDDSNADTRLRRNRLRAAVWPALVAAFPDAEATLAAAARRVGEALACADELAESDLPQVDCEGGLRIDAWLRLSAARRGNVLRTWLARRAGVAAPASLIERLQDELPGGLPACWPLPGGNLVLRRYRGLLGCERAAVDRGPDTGAGAPPDWLGALREGGVDLPDWGGRLHLTPIDANGLALDLLPRLRLAARHGGERWQTAEGRPPRSLKKQFQARGVPAWRRDGPLLYAGDALVYVPGLGVDARSRAAPGTPQVAPHWEPDGPASAR